MDRVIAIVEDSDDVAALEFALSCMAGFRVVKLPDGRSLMNALRTDSLELAAIVTDLNLPFYDGFEILEAVRAHHRYSQVPIIVITGDGRSEVPKRARELGASGFFIKPYSPAEIRRALEALIHAS
jgi:DNA-binding response OmpR family regulator